MAEGRVAGVVNDGKSEGEKQQAVNVSEGERQQQINRAEGDKRARILEAEGMIVPQDMGDLSKAIGTALRTTENVKSAA